MIQTVYYIAGSIAAIGTLVAAIMAVCVYRRNWRLEQSRWASSFHEKFYESDKYKTIREKLDRGDETSISNLVEAEGAGFTDYLNFFEHVAIFAKSKQLNTDDVEASFAYCLICLDRLGAGKKYIEDDKNGFEQLKDYLQNRNNP